jgi:hypothetical protein
VNSRSPSDSCSRFSAWLAAGWVIANVAAARVRLPSAITLSKIRSRFRSSVRKFGTDGRRLLMHGVYILNKQSSVAKSK